MKYVSSLLFLCGCSTGIIGNENLFLYAADSRLQESAAIASNFWGEHGVQYLLDPYQPTDGRILILTVKKFSAEKEQQRLAECVCDIGHGAGTIAISEKLAESTNPIISDLNLYIGCVLAHEMGHSFGMQHVVQGNNLMAPFIAPPGQDGQPDDVCPWSSLDQAEFENTKFTQ